MRPLGEPRRHFWLTLGMAKATGVDLARALSEGRITRTDYADMVHACRGCSSPDDCARQQADTTAHQTPPPYCQNAATFAALKP